MRSHPELAGKAAIDGSLTDASAAEQASAGLDRLSPELLADPPTLRHTLQTLAEQPWCNVTAYPVGPVHWEGTSYARLQTATHLFGHISPFLTETILGAKGDVVQATEAINDRLAIGEPGQQAGMSEVRQLHQSIVRATPRTGAPVE